MFVDNVSGKSRAERKALAEMIGYLRDDDTVRVASMGRLGRDIRDLYNLVAEIYRQGCSR
ncbi:MAG: recombinase family protein [Yaniella sp.]|uniref:recombinase family protein n=1 Tax=Yaniella sp. TaxID=2773929 RepID=UPI003F99E2F8